MLEISQYCLVAATILVGLAMLASIAGMVGTRRVVAARTADGRTIPTQVTVESGHDLGWYSTRLTQLAFALMTVSLVCRAIVVHHAPFANQYEFACSFSWGMLTAYVWFEARHHARSLALVLLPIALTIMIYAGTQSAETAPLLPALQNQLLLTLHVIFAVLGYGAAAVASAAGILYLVKPHLPKDNPVFDQIPGLERLDELGYRAVVISFPLLTIMNILGAIWANIAWGKYWSWDPKETSALMTWLIYGAYLHARVTKDWRGSRSAALLIVGFIAVLFTFFGNYFFGGMHSYA